MAIWETIGTQDTKMHVSLPGTKLSTSLRCKRELVELQPGDSGRQGNGVLKLVRHRLSGLAGHDSCFLLWAARATINFVIKKWYIWTTFLRLSLWQHVESKCRYTPMKQEEQHGASWDRMGEKWLWSGFFVVDVKYIEDVRAVVGW